MSRAVVIDADVVRSAGETEVPSSRCCRVILTRIFDICHRAELSPYLKGEWAKHASKWSRTWHVSMAKRGKIVSHGLVQDWRPSLALLSDREREIAEHDAHLIDSALGSEHIIFSGDDEARVVFGKLAEHEPRLRRIFWANPVRQHDRVCDWMKNGLRANPEFRLG